MPDYVLGRDYVLRSVMGHTICFEKNKPVHVPPCVEREAIAIGADRADNGKTDILPEEGPPAGPSTPDELEGAMMKAFAVIAARDDAKDFTAQGAPKVTVVEKLVGTNLDAKAVQTAWREFTTTTTG